MIRTMTCFICSRICSCRIERRRSIERCRSILSRYTTGLPRCRIDSYSSMVRAVACFKSCSIRRSRGLTSICSLACASCPGSCRSL